MIPFLGQVLVLGQNYVKTNNQVYKKFNLIKIGIVGFVFIRSKGARDYENELYIQKLHTFIYFILFFINNIQENTRMEIIIDMLLPTVVSQPVAMRDNITPQLATQSMMAITI